MYYCCKIECEVIIRSNAEIVCQEQTVMTRVAGDIQSSSQWNSGGRRLLLKTLEWDPPVQRSVALETFLFELANIKLNKPKDNLSHGEQNSLKELSHDKNIVLKKADKGEFDRVLICCLPDSMLFCF